MISLVLLIDTNFMGAHLGPEDPGLTILGTEDKKQNSSIWSLSNMQAPQPHFTKSPHSPPFVG